MASRLIVVISFFLLWLGSCTSPSSGEEQASRVDAAESEPSPKPVRDTLREALHRLPRAFGDLDSMLDRRQIRALVPYNHTMYYVDGNRRYGIAYEGLTLFEEELNKRLPKNQPKAFVVFLPVPHDEMIELLEGGYGDLAVGNLTITPERLEKVDFSDPAFRNARELVITGPNSPELETLTDLAGQKIMAMAGSSHLETLREWNREFVRQGLSPMNIQVGKSYLEVEDLLEMVNAGTIPLTVSDDHVATIWEHAFDSMTVRRDLVLKEDRNIAWAFRKDSPLLKKTINQFLQTHRQGTLLGNVVINRYLKHNRYIDNHTSEQTRQRFQELSHLFEHYANRYELDFHFLLAQAYQESKLNQNLVSHAGAVGIMQVKPSTAKGPPVFVENIHVLENNLNAGAKYMYFLNNKYLASEEMDDLNRYLLALASYNAGPHRIHRIREHTRRMGLDPNQWFNHVEMVVAREVGRETVQYVGNVYKYYLTFKYSDIYQDLVRARPMIN